MLNKEFVNLRTSGIEDQVVLYLILSKAVVEARASGKNQVVHYYMLNKTDDKARTLGKDQVVFYLMLNKFVKVRRTLVKIKLSLCLYITCSTRQFSRLELQVDIKLLIRFSIKLFLLLSAHSEFILN